MITSLIAIVYVYSVSDDGSIQKGSAISRTDEDGYQVYKFLTYQPNPNIISTDYYNAVQPFEEDNVYQISGKFGLLSDGFLEVVITTSLKLEIEKDEIPISKPFANFISKTLGSAEIKAAYYTLPIQVKPYLSKE